MSEHSSHQIFGIPSFCISKFSGGISAHPFLDEATFVSCSVAIAESSNGLSASIAAADQLLSSLSLSKPATLPLEIVLGKIRKALSVGLLLQPPLMSDCIVCP